MAAKEIMRSYYGAPPHHAYFDGCSTGGRQGLMEAQRFPQDFDGILAGAPVFDLPDMLWQYRKNSLAVGTTPISPERLRQLGEFIRLHYDRLDGLEDGVIGDPLAVDFVPSRDLPRAGSAPDGFADDELRALDMLYAPVVADGREIFPRTVIGGEMPGQVYAAEDRAQFRMESAWVGRVVPNSAGQMIQPFILESWFRYLAFDVDDPARDWKRMDPVRDGAGMAHMRRVLRAADPNLHAFGDRGGKLILYHGWADFGVNPLRTLDYFDQVAALSSRRVDDYARLYLIPGMFHCSGGTNVDYFDLMTPLIGWVEAGQRPGAINASRIENGKVSRTRPLCPYPEVARYQSVGTPDRAESFRCDATPQGSRSGQPRAMENREKMK
jgi:feruloyl esterase